MNEVIIITIIIIIIITIIIIMQETRVRLANPNPIFCSSHSLSYGFSANRYFLWRSRSKLGISQDGIWTERRQEVFVTTLRAPPRGVPGRRRVPDFIREIT
jgi:hypothetical protein